MGLEVNLATVSDAPDGLALAPSVGAGVVGKKREVDSMPLESWASAMLKVSPGFWQTLAANREVYVEY